MRLNHRYTIIVIFLMTFGLFAADNDSFAQSKSYLNPDASRVSWTHLSFHAKNFWVEVSTDIQMKSRRASDLDAVLPASPKGVPIKPRSPLVNEMTINTTISPRFRSPVIMHDRIWFNPTDVSTLGRIRLRRGEDNFKKIYRFTDQGVFRHRIEPQNKGEARLEPHKWTDIKDSFYPYDMIRLGCPGISERSVLIYLLSAAAMSKDNTPLEICIFGKRQLHRVKIQKEGKLPINVNYVEKTRQGKNRKESALMALKMTIAAQPIASHLEAAENFSFLGFHKDITVYLDPNSGLPIQASGVIPTIGKAQLKLRGCQIEHLTN